MENSKVEEVAALLMKTGHAHHEAFMETNGVDPEWAFFYAKKLQEPMSKLLNNEFTQSRIIYELLRLEETADISNTVWPKVYAADLVKKYS